MCGYRAAPERGEMWTAKCCQGDHQGSLTNKAELLPSRNSFIHLATKAGGSHCTCLRLKKLKLQARLGSQGVSECWRGCQVPAEAHQCMEGGSGISCPYNYPATSHSAAATVSERLLAAPAFPPTSRGTPGSLYSMKASPSFVSELPGS